MKYLTVFSDASFHPESGAAGYAFFVRDDRAILKRSFQVPFEVKRSVDAELFAMCHAIRFAVENLSSDPGDCIVAQTDCDHVIRVFQGEQQRDEWEVLITGSALSATQAAGLLVRFKHVKAHTGAKDARSYVNRWCDIAARREMKKRKNLSRSALDGAWCAYLATAPDSTDTATGAGCAGDEGGDGDRRRSLRSVPRVPAEAGKQQRR